MQPCCADKANRSEPQEQENGLTIQTCLVCNRRHFELAVDPIHLGVHISKL